MKILIIIILLCNLLIVKKITKGWLSPARISTIIWTFFILGYLLFTTKKIEYNGIYYLILGNLFFAFGEYFGSRVKIYYNKTNIESEKKTNKALSHIAWRLLFIFISIAIIYNWFLIMKNGYDFSYFLNLKKFLLMNSEMAYKRYSGKVSRSILESILASFIYLSSLYGGYLFPYSKNKRQKMFSICAIVPALFNVMFQNAKLVLLDSLFLWFVGFSISYMQLYKKNPSIKRKNILIIFTLILAISVVFFFSMCAKIGEINLTTIEIVKNKFLIYVFGSIDAFASWFSNIKFIDYGFGINTFMAPFDLFGVIEREQGVYDFITGIDSNVFTGYRALISDFGKYLSLILVGLFGLIEGISYRYVLEQRNSIFGSIIYGAALFTVLHYWLGSPWVYISYWLVFILFSMIIIISNLKVKD